jgi:hypothetical protein
MKSETLSPVEEDIVLCLVLRDMYYVEIFTTLRKEHNGLVTPDSIIKNLVTYTT